MSDAEKIHRWLTQEELDELISKAKQEAYEHGVKDAIIIAGHHRDWAQRKEDAARTSIEEMKANAWGVAAITIIELLEQHLYKERHL